MLFDAIGTKNSTIERLANQPAMDEVIDLDFGNPGEFVSKAIKFPVEMQLDSDGDHEMWNDEFTEEEIAECFSPEDYKSSKFSDEASKYHSMPSMFRGSAFAGVSSPLQIFYNNIVGDFDKFVEACNIKPHWQQQEFFDAYSSGETNIAIRSGQGPGKTFASCVVWLHWLLANPYSLLVTTAPTMRQCKDVWLAQARQIIKDADPRLAKAFEFTNTGIKVLGHKASDWGCYLATANKAENFQGIHREKLGIHCEESSGLNDEIIRTIQGTLSNAEGTYLWTQIGNPNTRDCAFYDCFYSPASVWFCLHWNGEETPETKFFSQRRNKEVADEFGRDSDIYRVRVLGEFPSMDPTSMITLEELVACTKPEIKRRAMILNAKNKALRKLRRHIGIDLARFGGDENCNVAWEGNIQLKMECYSRIDPNDAVDRAVKRQEELSWDNTDALYIVDTSGMGEAAVGRIGQAKRMGRRVHEFYSQNAANDSTKYANKITEAWCLFCKAIKAGDIYILYDKRTFDQLIKRRYSVDKRGRILIESKDDYKKRQKGGDEGALGKSPDRADALLMGYYPCAEESSRIKAFE